MARKQSKDSPYVRVSDATTGKLKRYEDNRGRALAVMIDGRLRITSRGADMGLVISEGRLRELGKEYSID